MDEPAGVGVDASLGVGNAVVAAVLDGVEPGPADGAVSLINRTATGAVSGKLPARARHNAYINAPCNISTNRATSACSLWPCQNDVFFG